MSDMSDMETRMERLPLPAKHQNLLEVLNQILRLGYVQRLEVDVTGITVQRAVPPDTSVVPDHIKALIVEGAGTTIELDVLLEVIALIEAPFAPDRAELHTLLMAFEELRAKALLPTGFYVRRGDYLPAFLGLPEGSHPEEIFGVPVNYVDSELLEADRMLLVGSHTGLMHDAKAGIIFSIGGGT